MPKEIILLGDDHYGLKFKVVNEGEEFTANESICYRMSIKEAIIVRDELNLAIKKGGEV